MTTEHQDVHVLSPHGEPRGLQMTEETFEPAGLVLTVTGELDIATAPSLRDQLTAAIDAGRHRLVIDLAAIVHTKQRLPEHGKLALAVDPSSYVMLVFESGGLPQILDLVETREQAIEHVSR
jgi:hypothetical protein